MAFILLAVHFPPLPTKKVNPPPPRSSSGNGLLPTPDDFPLFGPSQKKDCYNNGAQAAGTEGDADQYGLRALVKGIVTQPNPLTTDPESRSHYSLAELGFPSDFRDGFFPKRQALGENQKLRKKHTHFQFFLFCFQALFQVSVCERSFDCDSG